MKKILITLLITGIGAVAIAQTTDGEGALKKKANLDTGGKWKTGGTFNMNFSQVSLTNWAGGGQNSVGLNGLLSLYGNKSFTIGKKTDKIWSWENSLDMAYGVLRQGDDAQFIKNDDRLEFNSKIGRQLNEKWYLAGLLNFRTQFALGWDDPLAETPNIISKFMAPGYMLIALGVDYKPSDKFSMFIAPITSKTTFVMDPVLSAAGAFGVDAGSTVREELGGYVRFGYKSDLIENVTLDTKLDLFTNYFDPASRGDIDVNWTTLLSMKVNKYISCTFSTHLIYDDDIDTRSEIAGKNPRTQFKQMFGAGLAYKF